MRIEPYYEGMPAPHELTVKNIEVDDLKWGGKFSFCWAIVGGSIDARFINAIKKGIMSKMEEGPLTGSYCRDIRVSIYDGKMHPVDSNEISFKLAARNAFKEAFRNAGPKIMEPIYSVEILVPSEYMGAVMSDVDNVVTASGELLLDPFAYQPGKASAIQGLGGPTRHEDLGYAFHTDYVHAAEGPCLFTVRFSGLSARMGTLQLRVHMFVEDDTKRQRERGKGKVTQTSI